MAVRPCATRWANSVLARRTFCCRIEGCPFYIGAAQFEYWKHTELTIDVVPGRGGGFSLESPEGLRFLTRSRVFTDEEWAELEAAPALPTGADA